MDSESTSVVNAASDTSLDQSPRERRKDLNPDAPDFTPIDFKPTYRSEFAGITSQRRSTIADYYNPRQERTRNHSEPHPTAAMNSGNASPIVPLLSLMPEYNRSELSEDPRRRSKTVSSSYQSKVAYPLASPLMDQSILIDENFYPNITPTHRYGLQRPRAATGRSLAVAADLDLSRKRAHSGPEALVQPSEPVEPRLSGIHSLTRIMVDILRSIHPVSISEESQSISTSTSSIQSKYGRPSEASSQGRLQPRSQQADESLGAEERVVVTIPAQDPTVEQVAGILRLIRLCLLRKPHFFLFRAGRRVRAEWIKTKERERKKSTMKI